MIKTLHTIGAWLERLASLFEPPTPYDLLDVRLARLEKLIEENGRGTDASDTEG